MNIQNNIEIIKEKIENAKLRSGRSTECVKLMAVSKFHPIEAVYEAIAANQFLFGENRVQEACQKFEKIYDNELINNKSQKVELHLIGQLQTNKVKHAVSIAQCIQSVDRIELLDEIEKQCAKLNKTIKVLFEIHTAEDSKSGYDTEEKLYESLEACAQRKFNHIIPCGFMTMAPFTDDEKLIRKSFITLRELSEKVKKHYNQFDMNELSMGMSGDFEIAIEEGSTLVRIGTAIFGERDYTKK